ncbi:MAG: hypothetical protein UY50_C0026G0011 [Parcubacteria group bacterium GW2011_GWA2_49_9]|nr:MAG: hypothetical protein UY50_C0026G0011 [Parcubacteria group bacterium GW2011_GWA2_49_9]
MPKNVFSGLLGPDAFAPWIHAKDQMVALLHWLAPYSTVISLLIITGIVYCFVRIEQIVHATKYEDKPHGGGHGEKEHGSDAEVNPAEKKWERVQAHLNSANESDWRLGILEADVMLDEMVGHMGYHGDSLGEKLKGVEKSDFTTLDLAWEAHGVRNRIAHEGGAFILTEREAKRVATLYEDVFREFHYL